MESLRSDRTRAQVLARLADEAATWMLEFPWSSRSGGYRGLIHPLPVDPHALQMSRPSCLIGVAGEGRRMDNSVEIAESEITYSSFTVSPFTAVPALGPIAIGVTAGPTAGKRSAEG